METQRRSDMISFNTKELLNSSNLTDYSILRLINRETVYGMIKLDKIINDIIIEKYSKITKLISDSLLHSGSNCYRIDFYDRDLLGNGILSIILDIDRRVSYIIGDKYQEYLKLILDERYILKRYIEFEFIIDNINYKENLISNNNNIELLNNLSNNYYEITISGYYITTFVKYGESLPGREEILHYLNKLTSIITTYLFSINN